jgi:Holliday junction DNA helicase RuvA
MIGRIRGKIIEKNVSSVVVDVNGVGYEVYISGKTMSNIDDEGEVDLFVHTLVREDAIKLYGFMNREEREVFEKLISISNIGPKVAIAILSKFSPQEFIKLVEAHEFEVIAQVPGIGEKTAKRLIVELKDKIDLAVVLEGKFKPSDANKQVFSDAKNALLGLGFSAKEIELIFNNYMEKNRDNINIEDIIKFALKR